MPTPSARQRRPSMTRYTAAMAHCVRLVPSAAPATPMPTPCTSVTLAPTFSAAPAMAMTSGVRVSCSPRSTPVAAVTSRIAGSPGSDHHRYDEACSSTAP